MTTKPQILDLNNFEDFKKAVLQNLIPDYAPYIEHTPGITPPDDEVYERRRWLLQKDIATEQIAETATEDEQVYIIHKRRATEYYESWLSNSGRIRRSLASNGYFPEILINDKFASIRCDVVEQHPEYLPQLFRKEITKREWRTIIDIMWGQKYPNPTLLNDLLHRKVPQKLKQYSYERLNDLREKFTVINYVPTTIEKTMTIKQLYEQNSPAWKLNCSAEQISNIHIAEDLTTELYPNQHLTEIWDFIIGPGDIPPYLVIINRIETLDK